MTPLASCVLATLETASRPINRRELADLCGPHGCKISTAERQIRAAVAELCFADYPVYSDGVGFRLARTAEEMKGWIAQRRGACYTELLKLNHLEKRLPKMHYPAANKQNLFEARP